MPSKLKRVIKSNGPRTGPTKANNIDIEKLASFCRTYPSLRDTAFFFETSEATIELVIANKTGLTFTEFRDKNMVNTRSLLRKKAIEQGLAGDKALLIFCLKALCGWADKQSEAPKDNSATQLIEAAQKLASLSPEMITALIKSNQNDKT